ncbi:MAG: penicillin-binding protein 1C [Pseudobacteriovorax sp.]|nr:penicillin-binding protein 1C [Pseudobacteriovorax sp.]
MIKPIVKIMGAVILIYCFLALTTYLSLRDRLIVVESPVTLYRSGDILNMQLTADEQWRIGPLNGISERIRISLIQFEDKRFLSHLGWDPIAILRAVVQNISQGRIVSGASTITMQLARLSLKNSDRSLSQKFLELWFAAGIELTHSKEEILRLYFSLAPYGGNTVGVTAGCLRIFGRICHELSWAEAALMAIIPQNPNKPRAKLKEKRDILIDRLKDHNYLSDLDATLAKLEPIPLKTHKAIRTGRLLHETLSTMTPASSRVQTTLDKVIHDHLRNIATSYSGELSKINIHNMAALVIDVSSNEVLAYLSNRPGKSLSRSQGLQIDLIRSRRSTGSTLKPFLYAALLDEGKIHEGFLLPDSPAHFSGYHPKNFDRRYRGLVPAAQALAHSLNVPAVHMLRDYGLHPFYDLLTDLGFSFLSPGPDRYGLTLVLGGAEASLWELSEAYSYLIRASQGLGPTPLTLHKHRHSGEIAATSPLFSQGAAWLTLEALKRVKRPGLETFWESFSSSRQISWKTGTSFGFKDAWSLGTDGRYLVATWVGNATGQGNRRLTGTRAAAPFMFQIFDSLPAQSTERKPQDALKQIEVCQENGRLSNGHCSMVSVEIPKSSPFNRITTEHETIYIDPSTGMRIHGSCHSLHKSKKVDMFLIPPMYLEHINTSSTVYKKPPEWHPECLSQDEEQIIAIIYPKSNANLYPTKDISKDLNEVVLKAIHNDPKANIYWHLNESFVGTTHSLHELTVSLGKGVYHLTVMDQAGNRSRQIFRIH